MNNFIMEIRAWLAQALALENTLYIEINDWSLAMIFLCFYGSITIVSLAILLLSRNMRGIAQSIAFGCIALCLCLGGGVAALSISLNIEHAAKRHANLQLSTQPAKAGQKIPVINIPGTGNPVKAMEAASHDHPEILEQPAEPVSRFDENGYPLHDDISHERLYPEKSGEY